MALLLLFNDLDMPLIYTQELVQLPVELTEIDRVSTAQAVFRRPDPVRLCEYHESVIRYRQMLSCHHRHIPQSGHGGVAAIEL
jgi:hypothetical protein